MFALPVLSSLREYQAPPPREQPQVTPADTQLSLKLDRIVGTPGRSPSVDGLAPLVYKDELKPAFEDVKQYASMFRDEDFAIGVLAGVGPDTFRTYTVLRTGGRLSALDTTFDCDTRLLLHAKPVVSIRNVVFTWAGVVGIAEIWFDTLKER